MLLLTSLTSCCTSTTTTYLNLPSRKSNSVSVNSPNPTLTPKAHRIIALDASQFNIYINISGIDP